MNISFGKITYVNNTLNTLAPSIPKFKLVLYTDKHMDKTFVIMYTQNNKYVNTKPFTYFMEIMDKISGLLKLPFDKTSDIYYGDEILIELQNDNGDKMEWQNVKPSHCYMNPSLIKNSVISQKIYDTATQKMFTIMLDNFRNRIPETFYKKY